MLNGLKILLGVIGQPAVVNASPAIPVIMTTRERVDFFIGCSPLEF